MKDSPYQEEATATDRIYTAATAFSRSNHVQFPQEWVGRDGLTLRLWLRLDGGVAVHWGGHKSSMPDAVTGGRPPSSSGISPEQPPRRTGSGSSGNSGSA
jgi:hypothetical protein